MMLKFVQCIVNLFVKLFLLSYSILCCAIFAVAFFYGFLYVTYGRFTFLQFMFHLSHFFTMKNWALLLGVMILICSWVGLILFALKRPQLWLRHYVSEMKFKRISERKNFLSFISSTVVAGIGILSIVLLYPFSLAHFLGQMQYSYRLFFSHRYDTIIDDNFVNPQRLSFELKRPQNVIIVMAESLEQGFRDEVLFGENLLKNLTNQQGKTFVGYERLSEINWSFSGLVSMLCGITYKTYFPSRTLTDEFVCASDIWQQNGFYTYYLQGSPLKFVSLKEFLQAHHFVKYEGIEELPDITPDKLAFKNSNTSFVGDILDDRELLKIFRQKLTEIANAHQPFIAITATMNTHPYHGHVSSGCEKKYDDMRDAILCSDKELSDFVAWFKAQDFYDNTTLVIMGDHPMMYSDIQPHMDQVKNHATLNLMWGVGAPKESIDKPFNQFDWAPTLLEMAGFEWCERKFGLGTSLLSEEKTMQEKYGQALDGRLLNNSKVYDETVFVK